KAYNAIADELLKEVFGVLEEGLEEDLEKDPEEGPEKDLEEEIEPIEGWEENPLLEPIG
ncbi:hypothetical protein Ancab_031896, partial [Ancistrocladus abbreviatus]